MNEDKVKGNLRDLIEFPMETLENEYKGWVDLDDKITQAKIARHLAALTNHGGGHLVFGFRDDLSPDPNRPPSIAKIQPGCLHEYRKALFESSLSM